VLENQILVGLDGNGAETAISLQSSTVLPRRTYMVQYIRLDMEHMWPHYTPSSWPNSSCQIWEVPSPTYWWEWLLWCWTREGRNGWVLSRWCRLHWVSQCSQPLTCQSVRQLLVLEMAPLPLLPS
jgi:hypothetical protein